MLLFSTTYRSNQYSVELFQNETKGLRKRPKPILPKHLRAVWTLCRGSGPDRRCLYDLIFKVQGNELGLVGMAENRTGEKPPQENASAAKGKSRGQRERAHDDAQNNNVHEQVGDVVFLIEVGVLVPGDAGDQIQRTE